MGRRIKEFPSRLQIGERLKQLRLAKGYSTQAELCNYLGFNRNTYSSWERGVYRPSTEDLWLLSQVYGMTLEELLDVDDLDPLPVSEFPVRCNRCKMLVDKAAESLSELVALRFVDDDFA